MLENYPIDGSRDALWMATACEPPMTTALQGDKTCDVVIVGAGFTGLNAALHLASAGHSVSVLEAQQAGFGASGRSGGQVNIGLNLGPSALVAKFGHARATRMIDCVNSTPDYIFNLIKRHQMRCDPVQKGWIQGAINQQYLDQQVSLAREQCAHGADFRILDRAEITQRSGAQGYVGGLFCPAAGSIQPLSYTRELARVAIEQGATIHPNSAVNSVQADGNNWQVATAQGMVTCKKVLICTNGYTDSLIPDLAQKIVPVRSILIASEPLSAEMQKSILPGYVTFVDKRQLILFFRYDRDGRLCVGDHGPMRDTFKLTDYTALKRRVLRVFPQLASVSWDYHWGGRVAMTRNSLPFLHEPSPGLVCAMGYNGRGVGMGSVMGSILSEYIINDQPDELAFPLTNPKNYPLHNFHRTGVNAAVLWYSILDRLA